MNLLVARTMPDGTEYEGQAGRQFIYKTQTSVTTVVGQASPDANQPTVGGDIATSTLSAPNYISLDDEDNIFITERHVWHGGNNYPSVTCQMIKERSLTEILSWLPLRVILCWYFSMVRQPS